MTQTAVSSPNRSPTTSSRKGYVDTASSTLVSGWVHDPTRSSQPLFVDIEINAERIARLKACLYRGDLQRLGFGDGHVAFAFDPSHYLRGGENQLRVYFAGTDEIVDGGIHVLLNVEGCQTQQETETHELLDRSQARWRGDELEQRLTWGAMMTGDSFVDVMQKHHSFTGAENLLEIGPGYGRLLNCILQRRIPFARFIGLELSAPRVDRLARRFPMPNVQFLQADILQDTPAERIDIVLCSSTFEHLFPSMAKALDNIRAMTAPKAQLFIDFIISDGDDALQVSRAYFEDTTAYIRIYSRAELDSMFKQAGFQVMEVRNIVLGKDSHGKDVRRALVVAERCG
jgi:SAM-dependent methyltransferase